MAIAGELSLALGDGDDATQRVSTPSQQVNTLVDLYGHHQQRIYRYCLALLRNPDDAEDATQETFTRAAPFLPNLPGDLSAYLTTVARNICCDVVRARARRSVPIETVPLADRKVSPERQSVDWDVVRRMWRQLTPSERLLFAYTFAGYKYEEIASRTGMSRPSVSVGLARARRRLRDLAAATGTLGLLPLGLRRLIDRASRRAANALNNAQAGVVGLFDQVGTIAAGLLSGVFVVTLGSLTTTPLAPTAARGTAGVGAVAAPAKLAGVAAPSTPRTATVARQATLPASPWRPATSVAAALPGNTGSQLLGSNATPADSHVSTMTASPDFPTDHTVFVGGSPDQCAVQCAGLWRSSDGGASWSQPATLNAQALDSILLPPAFPADPAVFVVLSDGSLEGSSAGDGSFSLIAPEVLKAAIAPQSTAGHDELAVLTQAFQIELINTGASAPVPTQGPTLPAGFTPAQMAFTAPDMLEVSGSMWTPAAASLQTATAFRCAINGSCVQAATFPDAGGNQVSLVTSPNVSTDHLVVADTPNALDISTDGGSTFVEKLQLPSGTTFQAVTVGSTAAGPRIVVSTEAHRSAVLVSDDQGTTFTDITGNLDANNSVTDLAAFADGSVLAAVPTASSGHFALEQTTGNGSWIKPS